MGRLVSINISPKKGTPKRSISSGQLVADIGLEGDAHATGGERQVSLLSLDDVLKAGLNPGDFAENFTLEDIDFNMLQVGTRIKVGNAHLEISQIGKECHTRCAIYKNVGECIMPKRGMFAKVIIGGNISVGDKIIISS